MDYLSVHSFKKGIVFELLYQSFEPLMNLELEAKLRRYDNEIFEHPETVGASLFLTQLKKKLIGMISWDPRQFPKAIVGYNCIVPEFQGKGFGKQQLFEMLKRLKDQGFAEAYVNTGDYPFYKPSQRMYTSCGFDEIQHHPTSNDSRYGTIEYRINLKNFVNPVNPMNRSRSSSKFSFFVFSFLHFHTCSLWGRRPLHQHQGSRTPKTGRSQAQRPKLLFVLTPIGRHIKLYTAERSYSPVRDHTIPRVSFTVDQDPFACPVFLNHPLGCF